MGDHHPGGVVAGVALSRKPRYLGRTAQEARLVARGEADYLGIPGFMFDEPARARTHSVPDAPVAGGGGRFRGKPGDLAAVLSRYGHLTVQQERGRRRRRG